MKLRSICKSKIHHAVVTGADLNYIGSIGIDRALMRLTDIVPGECVSVWNVNNAWAELPEKLTRALDAKYQKAAKHGVAPHVEVVTAVAA